MQFSAKHILVETLEKAQKVKSQLGSYSFEDLAKTYSKCPSGKNGGDLGTFARGQMVPEFEKAVEGLMPEAVSDPVQTQFGWHIIKRLA